MNHDRHHIEASNPTLFAQSRVPYREAWERYMNEGRPVNTVRPEILHLWRRFRIKKDDEGTVLKWAFRFPSQAYWPYMSTLANLHTDLSFLMEQGLDDTPLLLLCDNEGTVIDLYPSNHPLLLPPYGLQVMLHLLDEQAPPTALHLVFHKQRMNWMIGAEHPHPLFHPFTSFAWPLPALAHTEKLYLVLLHRGFSQLDQLLQLGNEVIQLVLKHAQTLPASPAWSDQYGSQTGIPPERIAPHHQPSPPTVAHDQPSPPMDGSGSTPSSFSEDIAQIVHELRNPLTALQGYLTWQKDHISAQDDAVTPEVTSQAPLVTTMLDELKAVSQLLDRLLWRYHQEAPRSRILSFGTFLTDWLIKHHEILPKRIVPRIMYAFATAEEAQNAMDLAIFDPKQLDLALELITSLYDPQKLLPPILAVGEKHLHLFLRFSTRPTSQAPSHQQDWESARRIIIVNRGRIRRFERFQLITLTLPRYTP